MESVVIQIHEDDMIGFKYEILNFLDRWYLLALLEYILKNFDRVWYVNVYNMPFYFILILFFDF